MTATTITRRAFLNEVADELESGGWRQGQSRLRGGEVYDLTGVDRPQDYDDFCCLGVACEVAVRHGLLVRVGDGYGAPGTGEKEGVVLPGSLAEWLTGDPIITDPRPPGADSPSFTAMNDDMQLPFPEIAAHFRAWAAAETS